MPSSVFFIGCRTSSSNGGSSSVASGWTMRRFAAMVVSNG